MAKKNLGSLTADEQQELKRIISKRNERAPVVKRAYVLLSSDENSDHLSDTQIAERYKVTIRTIEGLRKRFVEQGFSVVLHGKKRTVFKEKRFDGRVEAQLISFRCTAPPQGHSAWTLQLA
jgi:hypothetical protein